MPVPLFPNPQFPLPFPPNGLPQQLPPHFGSPAQFFPPPSPQFNLPFDLFQPPDNQPQAAPANLPATFSKYQIQLKRAPSSVNLQNFPSWNGPSPNTPFVTSPFLDEPGKIKDSVSLGLSSPSDYLQVAGLNDVLWQHLADSSNRRRLDRLERRLRPPEFDAEDDPEIIEVPKPKPRGRPPTSSQQARDFDIQRYFKKLSKVITAKDIKDYFAAILIMGTLKLHSQESYFLVPDSMLDPRGCLWISARISKWRFYFLHSCIDYDIDWISAHLAQSTQKVYVPTLSLASDETMTPTKSKINPHHMYVPGKPHPNGILSTSCGDGNGILLSLQVRRRTTEDLEPLLASSRADLSFDRDDFTPAGKKKMKNLIVDLCNYNQGSTVVIDRLYGGLDVVEDLAKKKVFCVAKCKANRPTSIFKDFLHKAIRAKKELQLGDHAVATGVFVVGAEHIRFYCYSVVSQITAKKTTIENWISTCPNHNEESIKINSIEETQEEEKDGTQVLTKKVVWAADSIGSFYNSEAGHIDEINSRIGESYPLFRFMRWKSKLLLTFLFGLVHNAHRFIQLHQNDESTPQLWRIQVANLLSPSPSIPSQHQLAIIPNTTRKNRLRCKLCSLYHGKKDKKTYYYCSGCQAPFCFDCFQDSGLHAQFTASPEGATSRFKAKFLIN